ncbi:unnamed protein product [Thelazia callipaeda]|uniref:E3 ubiquitin-protein ligase n=1 Tax=Thelazia callipaeda TaxID=103827 RepID=A0A158RD02_THECL|nr:unnamed protein product [Thelazia callipaeda]
MPRNSSNGAVTLSNGSSDGVVKSDEDETMEQARKLKNICDELKAAGCPLFGGRFCDELPEHIRTKADELDTFLNNLIGGSATDPFESGTRDELRILMAQGQTVETFKKKSMSLCSSCFKHSNHEGHDFNRFFSHSGGACDCGNVDVLNESGFCFRHGPNARRPPVPSSDIVSLGEFIIPKLFVRLFLYFRGWVSQQLDTTKEYRVLRSGASKEIFGLQLVSRAHILIEFIQELIDYGGPIRDVLVKNLLDRQLYKDLNKHSNVDHTKNSDRVHDLSLDWRTRHLLLEDIESLKPVTTTESSDNNTCYELECLLDELIFWMVRLIFPQVIVNLCLSLLSDVEYRDIFARRFFSWYLCIAEIIVELSSQEDDHTVYGAGSRIVHISVQILSSEAQCIMLDNEIDLRYKIISSACCVLKTGVQKSTITQAKDYFYECSPPSTDDDRLFKWLVYSVDANQPLRRTSFWTFMSDLQNLLTHGELARRFLFDSRCMRGYVDLIAPMQGMNLNYRIITGDHLEYDNQPYQLAFHFEWEVSSINMFNILSALTTEVDYMIVYLLQWKVALEKWFDAIGLTDHDLSVPPYCVSYHIPLHRHLSAGILRSIELSQFSSCLNHLAKNEEFLRKALLHPLRIQACRAETSAGMWARNGHAARNQSFYYAQTTYNIAFMECDLSLIRFVACFIDTEWLMEAIMKAFYLDNCFAFCGFLSYDHILIPSKERVITRKEWVDFLVDGGLRLLLDIVVVRWNTSGNDTGELKKEIVAALAVSDLTYSKLRSSIPDKGNRPFIDDRTFDVILGKVGFFNLTDGH